MKLMKKLITHKQTVIERQVFIMPFFQVALEGDILCNNHRVFSPSACCAVGIRTCLCYVCLCLCLDNIKVHPQAMVGSGVAVFLFV